MKTRERTAQCVPTCRQRISTPKCSSAAVRPNTIQEYRQALSIRLLIVFIVHYLMNINQTKIKLVNK